jgi:hypothetical protein
LQGLSAGSILLLSEMTYDNNQQSSALKQTAAAERAQQQVWKRQMQQEALCAATLALAHLLPTSRTMPSLEGLG